MRRIRFPVSRPRVVKHPRLPVFSVFQFPGGNDLSENLAPPSSPRVQSGTTAVRTRASPLPPRVPHSRAFRPPGDSAPGWPRRPTEADSGGSSVEVRTPERDNPMNSFGNSKRLAPKRAPTEPERLGISSVERISPRCRRKKS